MGCRFFGEECAFGERCTIHRVLRVPATWLQTALIALTVVAFVTVPYCAVAQSLPDNTSDRFVLEFPGTAAARSTVEVIPGITGVVQEVFVEVGQRVKRGDELLAIDPAEFKIAVDHARIELELSETLKNAAKEELERMEKLVERKLQAENALAPAIMSVQLAELGVQEAESDLEAAELALRRTKLRSPIDGIVSLESVASGDRLVANEMTAFVIVDYDPVIVAAQVDQETDLMLYRGWHGGTLKLESVYLRLIDGSVYSHSGEHVGSSNMVDPETGNMVEYYSFQNTDLMIPAGATVTVVATYIRKNNPSK